MVEQEANSKPKGGNISNIQPDRVMQDAIINRTLGKLKYRALRFLYSFLFPCTWDRLGPLLCGFVTPALLTAALRPLMLTSVASSALAYVRWRAYKDHRIGELFRD